MRMSEFTRTISEEFGADYATVLLRDHWLTELGGTPRELIDRGVPPRVIWVALCDDFQIPAHRRHGRGLIDPTD